MSHWWHAPLSLLILSPKTGFRPPQKIEGPAPTGDGGKYFNFACCPFLAAIYVSNGLLGAFANLRKATISSLLSVCLSVCLYVQLSVCPQRTTRLPRDRFWWNFDTWIFFLKSAIEIKISLKSDKSKVYFTWRPV